MKITEQFLLSFSFVMQVPMIMIVFSRFLVDRVDRYTNITAALISVSIQSFTLVMGFTLHYLFFSIMEIGAALLIIYFAATWGNAGSPKQEGA